MRDIIVHVATASDAGDFLYVSGLSDSLETSVVPDVPDVLSDFDRLVDEDYDTDQLDFELINDLIDVHMETHSLESSAFIASPSDAVSLETIHTDIQMLNYTHLLMYVILLVLFLVRKGR